MDELERRRKNQENENFLKQEELRMREKNLEIREQQLFMLQQSTITQHLRPPVRLDLISY